VDAALPPSFVDHAVTSADPGRDRGRADAARHQQTSHAAITADRDRSDHDVDGTSLPHTDDAGFRQHMSSCTISREEMVHEAHDANAGDANDERMQRAAASSETLVVVDRDRASMCAGASMESDTGQKACADSHAHMGVSLHTVGLVSMHLGMNPEQRTAGQTHAVMHREGMHALADDNASTVDRHLCDVHPDTVAATGSESVDDDEDVQSAARNVHIAPMHPVSGAHALGDDEVHAAGEASCDPNLDVAASLVPTGDGKSLQDSTAAELNSRQDGKNPPGKEAEELQAVAGKDADRQYSVLALCSAVHVAALMGTDFCGI
jgi:hypothetical protein